MAGWLAEIIQNEITFALRDWIGKKFGWIEVPQKQMPQEERERQAVLAKRAKDRRNRRKNR